MRNKFQTRIALAACGVILLAQLDAQARQEDVNGLHRAESRHPQAAPQAQAQPPAENSISDFVVSKIKSFFAGPAAAPAQAAAPIVNQARQPSAAQPVNQPAAQSVAHPSAQAAAQMAPVQAPMVKNENAPVVNHEVVRNLPKNNVGVESVNIPTDKIPFLELSKEERVTSQTYQLNGDLSNKFNTYAIAPFTTPNVLAPKDVLDLKRPKAAPAIPVSKVKGEASKFDKVSLETLEKLKWNTHEEKPYIEAKYRELGPQEMHLLHGILLYRKGNKCAIALSLFYPLTKAKGFESEGNYYLAMCSKQLGLLTDFYEKASRVVDAEDVYYSQKVFKSLGDDVPPELVDGLGKSLFKASSNKKMFEGVDPIVAGNVYYILANFGAKTERFKTAMGFADLVPQKHRKYLEARFLKALAEYEIGDKAKAIQLQTELLQELSLDKKNDEFQALVALNMARMQFQEHKFKEARENFLKVSKDHPLWVQSLTEMGWDQLQMGDYGGAIGNMYSVQSPFFNSVYKPESYVVRTIGYLNLCQYGDAYKTLSILEKQYRPQLDRIVSYLTSNNQGKGVYPTIKTFISTKATADVDTLPPAVIREMARHKDFLVRQVALNRQVEEKDIYSRFDKDVEQSLAKAQETVTKSRGRVASIKKQITTAAASPLLADKVKGLQDELEQELGVLSDAFFQIDLFTDAKKAVSAYRVEALKLAEKRIVTSREDIEGILKKRLTVMKEDLIRILDNNELLRYEVFSGSGENIRFQVAGGEKDKRVPASVAPKSKSLQWDFDGEYWEDEIGHYRSSLKNNCPNSKSQANANEGGNQ